MINVMENKVLGPMMRQKFEQGLQKGLEQGQQKMLRHQLTDKFGPLPAWAIQRLQSAPHSQLHAWGRRILHTTTLDENLT